MLLYPSNRTQKSEEKASPAINDELFSAIFSRYKTLVTGTELSDKINRLLEELGHITQVSRVWIFQTLELTDDYIMQDYVFEWVSDSQYTQIGLPRFNHFCSEIMDPEYVAFIQSLQRGESRAMITAQQLFTQADKMLYQAKHTGRNKIIVSKL